MIRFLKYLIPALAIIAVATVDSVAQEDVVISKEMSDELMNKSNIKGPLEFKGFVKELSKKLKGATVTLYESPDGSHDNLTEIFKTITPGNGMFEFKVEINKFYVLSVEKEGYTTKKVDFDTDVTLAREQYTSVPKFEFEVDMVKDLDGLAFSGSVAHVFYQIKQNKFDYELDYSKEEMEDEERELRERKEKARLAELAYIKKKEIEEAAKLLLDKENATAQQLIQAAVTVGDGDKAKIIKGFEDVFPEVDTLRGKKAVVMYDKLLEERERTSSTGAKIDFMSIFDSANAFEAEVEAVAEEKRQEQVEALRKEKEEVQRKSDEAMAIAQKALEVEAREKLAAAIQEEELRKAKEEKEKRDAVYYAIFESNGDSETAIQNLIKTYPKSDPYREQKANAIYAEYEKTRLTGTTLSGMDFGKLFEAADYAEQQAIKDELADDYESQNARLEAFKAKVEEQKREEQERTVSKIEEGLEEAPKDRASQIEVFKNALPKNEAYKDEKAEAMYEQYKKQREALNTLEKTINLVPKDKKTQYELFFNALPADTDNRSETAQKMYDSYAASVVFNKESNPTKQLEEEALIKESLPSDLPGKEQIAKAIFKAGVNSGSGKPNKAKQIQAIVDNLPGSLKNKQQVAEQIYDQYVEKKQVQGGTGTISLDFASLFGAAETAAEEAQDEAKKQNAIEKRKAQEVLEAKREEVRQQKREMAKEAESQVKHVHREELAKAKNKKERDLAEAIEKGSGDRDESVRAIMKALTETGDKELDMERAEAVYDAYLEESSAIESSGQIGKKVNFDVLFAAADQAELKKLEREFQEKEAEKQIELAKYEEERTQKAIEIAQVQQKQAEQEIVEAEKKYEETLLKAEAERQERLAIQQKEKEELEKSIAMERARREAAEKEKAAEELAMVEKERIERLERQQKEQERLAAIEAEKKRKAQELAEKQAAEQLALLEKQRRQEEEEERKRLEAEAKEAERIALAEQKREEERKKAEERRLAEEAKAAEELALAKQRAEEEARKAEERRLAEEAKAAEELALAKQKAEERRIAEEKKEAERLALEKEKEEQARIQAEEAAAIEAAKRAEEERIAEEKRQEELARQKAEEAERKRRAEYDRLVSEGDAALAKQDVRTGWQKYKDALAMYPDERALAKKFNDTDAQLQQIEKEAAEQLALNQKYNSLMQEAEEELAQNNYDAAKEKFQRASDLKPDEKTPKTKIRDIERTLDQLAEERKAKQLAEREYVIKLQDAAKALQANDLELAREQYEEANRLKPEDQLPIDKLKEISDKEAEIAKAAEEKKQREKEAAEKYAADLAAAEAKKQKEREERQNALNEIAQAELDAAETAQEREEIRKKQFEQIREEFESTDLTDDERRSQFLSRLAQLYPEGVTKETVNGKNFVLLRHVVNQSGVVTIYEKKTWDWGGVFYFKNTDIAITEALYKLEISKY